MPASESSFMGCLIGGAVGDALGLPYEGLSPKRVHRRLGISLRHRFVMGCGMISDDTDHAIFTTQALIRSGGDVNRFRAELACRLRWWLACLPAGIGLATLRSIAKMWVGIRSSGVRSAGNGPCMRSAILGVYFCDAPAARRRFVDASSTLTHTDERALAAARSIAEIAAALSSGKWRERPNRKQLELVLSAVSSDTVWLAAVQLLISLLETPLSKAALHFGGTRGVSGYALHSVPIAILAWHQHYGDYPAAIEAAIRCGGDVDTIAAIAGSLAGITAGPTGIPIEWQDRLAEWPHSVTYLHKLSRAISPGDPSPTHFSPWLFPRGIVFTLLVLLHGLGRLLPDRPAGASGE